MRSSARLERRRQELLALCEAQRAALADRLGSLRRGPLGWLRAGGSMLTRLDRHPFALLAIAGGMLVFGRTRRLLWAVGWLQAALSLASRTTRFANAIADLRRAR